MTRKNVLIGLGVSTVSAAVASGITWFVTKRILDEQYEERLDEEIKTSVKYILKQLEIDNVVVSDDDPDILEEQMNDAELPFELVTAELDTVSNLTEDYRSDEPEIVGERVFGSQDEKPPLEDLASRNHNVEYHKVLTDPDTYDTPVVVEEEIELPPPPPEDPDISIISRDIFMENGSEWEQETLTYFADDGVLNVAGDFVEDHEKMIGVGRPRFGEMSEDANVVYVRNKRLEKEFEIIADPGNASEFLAHSLTQLFKPSWER